ncbi:acetoacetate decarboxylase family protein [Natronorubrum sp. DTA7]|uniref:acetoacetate decarboxylase family protein n=1 Tax=Natronorubrum sp. DTA7 TaxID=3447016 RepID=UPI003F84C55A
MHSKADDPTRATLSTGHEIALPLDLEFALGGVTVPALRARLEALLPSGLSALAIAPGIGCVTFVGIQYHRVGGGRNEGADANDGETGLEPYDEFAVIVPAVRGSRTSLPIAQLVDGEVGGYVHWLPVTTDASVALGREIWGYPKERADITVTDGPRGLRAVVGNGGTETPTVRLEVPRPRTRATARDRDWSMWSYTTKGGDLLRTRAEIRGQIAVGSPVGASLEIESELRATLGCWNRPIARLYGSRARARLHAGAPVDAL